MGPYRYKLLHMPWGTIVVSCAEFHSDNFNATWMKTVWNFRWICITMTNHWMKLAPYERIYIMQIFLICEYYFSYGMTFSMWSIRWDPPHTPPSTPPPPLLLPPLPTPTPHPTPTPTPCYWPFVFVLGIHRSPMNSPHKWQWCGASMFSLICAWINGWVNNREDGDMRRHRAHYDVTAMEYRLIISAHSWCILQHSYPMFITKASLEFHIITTSDSRVGMQFLKICGLCSISLMTSTFGTYNFTTLSHL